MKQHQPSVEELAIPQPRRPYFRPAPKNPRCPYCSGGRARHAALTVYRIEGSRATEAARKEFLAKLPKTGGQFAVVEAKSKRQSVVYQWLENLARRFDFENDDWMILAAKAFLEKRLPKVNWDEVFSKVYRVRKSSRLEEGWEVDDSRLFLAPHLYDEALLFQYVLSRSHRYGGRTFEGRLTLVELLKRLRRRGYFEEHEIEAVDPHDVLEQLVESLDPGSATVRLYYVVDRRDFLKKLNALDASAR